MAVSHYGVATDKAKFCMFSKYYLDYYLFFSTD